MLPRQLITSLILLFSPWFALASISLKLKNDPQNFSTTGTKRVSEFSSMPRTSARGNCEATHPPEALATANPLLDQVNTVDPVRVSFIIGTDGHVYSPFILESAGPAEDRIVLNAVRSWRFRPATCNGVPAEAEAKVGFSSR
jgi:TonB family protein